MPLRLNSVRVRLTLWNIGIIFLVLLALGATLRYSLEQTLIGRVDQDMTISTASFAHRTGNFNMDRFEDARTRFRSYYLRDQAAQPASATATTSTVRGAAPASDQSTNPTARPADTDRRGRILREMRFIDLHGNLIVPFAGDTIYSRAAYLRSLAGQTVFLTKTIDRQPMRIISRPSKSNGKLVFVVQQATSLNETNQELGRLTRILLWLIVPALLVVGVGGAFLTDRALLPIRDLALAAEHIEAENLSGRLPVIGDDEITELARTFNGMLGRLENAFTSLEHAYEEQRRFVADASHELRTPLTIIKANTSLALSGEGSLESYRKSLDAADRAADRMGRIVGDLLLLARSDAGQLEVKLSPTKLSEVLELATESLRVSKSHKLDLAATTNDIRVIGNAELLSRLFSNLLSNAARHTPSEGSITIDSVRDGKMALIRVIDSGEGIADDHLPHVFERFYRVDEARSSAHGGTGLGLAICKSIVEAHHGQIGVASKRGEGTTVSVRLPLASPSTKKASEAQAISGHGVAA